MPEPSLNGRLVNLAKRKITRAIQHLDDVEHQQAVLRDGRSERLLDTIEQLAQRGGASIYQSLKHVPGSACKRFRRPRRAGEARLTRFRQLNGGEPARNAWPQSRRRPTRRRGRTRLSDATRQIGVPGRSALTSINGGHTVRKARLPRIRVTLDSTSAGANTALDRRWKPGRLTRNTRLRSKHGGQTGAERPGPSVRG